jgi:hypothetical protein
MRIAVASFFLLIGLFGCSSAEEPVTPGPTDTGTVVDTAVAEAAADTAADSSVDSTTDTTVPEDTADSAMEDTLPPPADTSTCPATGIGVPCNDDNPCPTDMRCYGFGSSGFCAPMMPECGGFANTKCTDGRACMRPGGSSLGYCATFDERLCICSKATTTKIDACPDPDAGTDDAGTDEAGK